MERAVSLEKSTVSTRKTDPAHHTRLDKLGIQRRLVERRLAGIGVTFMFV